jgi:hypothetical protein
MSRSALSRRVPKPPDPTAVLRTGPGRQEKLAPLFGVPYLCLRKHVGCRRVTVGPQKYWRSLPPCCRPEGAISVEEIPVTPCVRGRAAVEVKVRVAIRRSDRRIGRQGRSWNRSGQHDTDGPGRGSGSGRHHGRRGFRRRTQAQRQVACVETTVCPLSFLVPAFRRPLPLETAPQLLFPEAAFPRSGRHFCLPADRHGSQSIL